MVVQTDGKPLSFFRSLLRTGIKFLPWELSHYLIYRMDANGNLFLYLMIAAIYLLVIIYIMLSMITKRKQSLYDLIAGTVVRKEER